jgi:hypothetical protein
MSLDHLFDIASRVATPLALGGLAFAGLFAAAYYAVSHLVPQVRKNEALETIKFIIGALFIVAVLAMILGFVGYVINLRHDGGTPKESAHRQQSAEELAKVLGNRHEKGSKELDKLAKDPSASEETKKEAGELKGSYVKLGTQIIDAIKAGDENLQHDLNKQMFQLFDPKKSPKINPDTLKDLQDKTTADMKLLEKQQEERDKSQG